MSNGIMLSGGMILEEGRDETGYWVSYGPFLRAKLAIEVNFSGLWHIHKICSWDPSTTKGKRRAKKLRKWYSKHFDVKFRVTEIWETVPTEEQEIIRYETKEEVRAAFTKALRLSTGDELVVGTGRDRTSDPEEIEKILESEGQEIQIKARRKRRVQL